MVTIYVLIDPRNGLPFYVGLTKGNQKNRLSNHLAEAKFYQRNFKGSEHAYKKNSLINSIIADGYKPIMKAIFVCQSNRSYYCEYIAYNMLTNAGHQLHQSPNRFIHGNLAK